MIGCVHVAIDQLTPVLRAGVVVVGTSTVQADTARTIARATGVDVVPRKLSATIA